VSDDALIERHSSVGRECPDDLAVVLMWSPLARRVQDEHAAYILIEPVEKATDKRSESLLCCSRG
jgi:hypothetical protein